MQAQISSCCHAIVLLLLVVYCSYLPTSTSADGISWRYAVIIDAGSTGSRAHVFKYHHTAAAIAAAGGPASAYPVVELPEAVLKSTPGLSSYATNPKSAATSLQPLIKFAKAKVPAQQWRQTPIQLMATAGVRMLNSSSAQQIMTEVDKALSASGFDFTPASAGGGGGGASDPSAAGARVLSGAEEGLLGWVALNYASGALQAASASQQQQQQQHQRLGRKGAPQHSSKPGAPVPLLGVLELGGGSLQVTFVPQTPPPAAEAFPLALPSLGPGRLYSRSFDGLGLQAAMARWTADLQKRDQSHDPCLPVGFTKTSTTTSAAAAATTGTAKAPAAAASTAAVRGTGDWRACKAGVVGLLPKGTKCVYDKCGLAGTFLPGVEGATFVGVDNLFYTASALGLPTSQPTSLEAIDKAAATFCGHSWAHIRSHFLKNHKGDPADSYHAKVCFSAALILGLLKEGLHLPANQPLLRASNNITTPQGRSLEAKWPLGALVVGLVSSSSSSSAHKPRSSSIGGAHKPSHKAAHDHPMLKGSEGEDEGLSAGSAAALAAVFCMATLALSLCASWLGVGLPGNGRCGMLWQRLLRMHLSSSSVKVLTSGGGGGLLGGGSTGGGGPVGGGSSSSSTVRYMRVRPVSRGPEGTMMGVGGVGAGVGGRSRSPSPQHKGGAAAAAAGGGGEVGGPGGSSSSIMLTVLSPVGGEGGAHQPSSWSVDPMRSTNGYSGNKASSRSIGGGLNRQR